MHVFDRRLAHPVQRRVVSPHEIGARAGGQHDGDEEHRKHHGNKTCHTHAPIEDERDDDEGDRRHQRGAHIGQPVRHHGVGVLNGPIDDMSRLATGMG